MIDTCAILSKDELKAQKLTRIGMEDGVCAATDIKRTDGEVPRCCAGDRD
jgi:hypothetical protein